MAHPLALTDDQPSVVTIGVCSGKGGVGKTNVAVNVATALGARGNRVLLMDADLGLANIDVMLGCKPQATLEQVVAGDRTLDEIVVDGPRGVKIIPGASGVAEMADLNSLQQAGLINAFASTELEPEYLVVDVAAGIGSSVVTFCKAVQHLVVVVCDEPTSLADAYGLIKVLSQHGVKRFSVLANMARNEKQAYRLYHKLLRATDRFLDVAVTYLGMIPTDDNLKRALRNHKAVVSAYPSARSSRAFMDVADRLENITIPGLSSGRLEFFMERIMHTRTMMTVRENQSIEAI